MISYYISPPNGFLPDRFIEDPKLSRYLIRSLKVCGGVSWHASGVSGDADVLSQASSVSMTCTTSQSRRQLGLTWELYETNEQDISMFEDYVTPAPFDGSKGLRIVIRQWGSSIRIIAPFP
ncbi:hypothetical protein M441DRAFT_455868 [Trichoderma asperellum CBS 433.97]|uniref:Uncharacterized protein n=1 Tax=Trichoderma asperellum (strain ATCC 204424 / CBS 433.97 / NBRC 101777) TaxID=1042311 RepID=A0A2T3YQK4_TRIA4|nr:hypothetical protein M441DRAFT_455868 [Trichoderma asperellum CBS 433.97]PTB34799.1 hypothetical protein M441DRAFT_455868 [Trichoderma asperellum CBS 433.97]